MNVTIVGAGYVGLVTGTCLADLGHTVTCVDIDRSKINKLQQGHSPIYEPGLKELILKNIQHKRLFFSSNLAEQIANSDIIFIAVGTPQDDKTGEADLTAVQECAQEIARCGEAEAHLLIVIKSTVPVDTHQKLSTLIKKENPTLSFEMVSNPEFLREGSAIPDFMMPDRVVVGVASHYAEKIMKELYAPLINKGIPFIFTSLASAELIKYASNCFLATKISFINEMADLCERTGAVIEDVSHAMGLDKRIGAEFLKPGPGYGGSCFPKDTRALAYTAQQYKAPLSIVNAVIQANEKRKERMAQRIVSLSSAQSCQVISVLGVAFKAETDDIRESPALPIIKRLTQLGYTLRIYDPQALQNAQVELGSPPSITWCHGPYEALKGSDACVITTEWSCFKDLDLKKVASLLKKSLLIDLRNIFGHHQIKDTGLTYIPLGSNPTHML
jgi:UDPglucose 6-dehydrogenase